MKRGFGLSVVALWFFLLSAGEAWAQIQPGCSRPADEAARLATARALVTVNSTTYQSVINYWAEDVVYKEPVLTNVGRVEMLEYLQTVYGGSPFGFPMDKHTTIRNELYKTHPDGSMTYMATIEWSGTFGTAFFIQKGMSIVKFRPGEGCASYHRDYFTEGDSWWNIPIWQGDIRSSREMYIYLFGLTGRCFDEDGDGYTKYSAATGCPNPGLDCNDFVAEINPGVREIPGNGIDDDCNPGTPD